jgi:hypothetical protein
MRLSTSIILAFGLVATSVVVGCSSGDASSPPRPADPPGASATASEETTKAIGVVTWWVAPEAQGITHVIGVDADGEKRADVVLGVESRGPNAAIFTYDVRAPEAATLRYEAKPEGGTADLAAFGSPLARQTLQRLGADLEQRAQTPASSLVTASYSTRPLSGGFVGHPTTPLVGPPQCMLDKSGNGCVGQLVSTAGCIVATGICLIADGFTGGLITAACGAGAVSCAGSVVSMYESGCQLRDCDGVPTS